MFTIHEKLQQQLKSFCEYNQVPNILFHGPPGSGKKTLLQFFLQTIYKNNKENIQKYVICVNCAHAHGKGIKFIREELKFFAKTHIHNNGGHFFKSIILTNGDKLTTDAQSALRRCIEMFTFNTRFFIVVEDKYRLLKPILSRFCEIFVPSPPKKTFYERQIDTIFLFSGANLKESAEWKESEEKEEKDEIQKLKKDILKTMKGLLLKKETLAIQAERRNNTKKTKQSNTNTNTNNNNNNNTNNIIIIKLMDFCKKLYEEGYCGLDLIRLVESPTFLEETITTEKRYEYLILFHKIRREIRNEKQLFLFLLNFLFLDLELNIETLSFL